MKRALLLLVLLLGTGCVYYNGMYNTKQFAKRARKAEREGRTFDAANFWGQVSVKAETLLVKHPRSKYAEEARLLYGTARARLKDCSSALPELEQVMLTSQRADFAEEAAAEVGTCKVILGDNLAAATAFSRLNASAKPERRDLALYAHGQALRLDGQYEAALRELNQSRHARARGERAAALAGSGQVESALRVADSLIAARDTSAPWPAILSHIGEQDLAAASSLTDRIVADTARWPVALRARLLIDDGLRLGASDPARGADRLEQATRLPTAGERAVEAQVLLLRQRFARVERVDSMRQMAADAASMSEGAGSFMPGLLRLSTVSLRAARVADSVEPGVPEGDLRLFLAGELARDSVEAPRFAAVQFRRIVTEWPASPFAPKALLALILLEPATADSLRDQMRNAYPASPYLLLVDGSDSPELAVLEDSLRHFSVTFGTARPDGAPQPARQPPGVQRPGSAQPARPNRPTAEPQ